MGESAQGDLSTGGRFHIDMLEAFGVLPELRVHFEHHMVLVELGVHRGDLPLAEGIVKRVVDHLRGDAEPPRGGPIDNQGRLESLILLVAVQVE